MRRVFQQAAKLKLSPSALQPLACPTDLSPPAALRPGPDRQRVTDPLHGQRKRPDEDKIEDTEKDPRLQVPDLLRYPLPTLPQPARYT